MPLHNSFSLFGSAPKQPAPVLADILSAIDAAVTEHLDVEVLLCRLDASRHALATYFCRLLNSEVAAKALTIKVLNLLLAKYHFLLRDTVLLSKPYGIVVDTANGCNLACPGCVHSASSKELHRFEWNSGMLSEDRCDALLRQYGPSAIQTVFYNYGEPLLNPNTPEFIRKAKAYLTRTALSTNLSLKRFDAQAYVLSGLDFMTLSIDGATQPVYERFRKQGNIETVFSNIQRLVEAKRREGRASPILNWQFLAFEHNAHEIGQAIELARSLGVDQITIGTPFDVSWDDPGIRPADVEPRLHQFHVANADQTAGNWNPFPLDLNRSEIERAFDASWADRLTPQYRQMPRSPSPPARTCHYLYKNMVMDANGRIFPCCAAPQPGADLHFASFEAGEPEAFNAEKFRLARMSFADHAAYQSQRDAGTPFRILAGPGPEPYCVKCEWYDAQLTAHVDRAEVRGYLHASQVFDPVSARILSSW